MSTHALAPIDTKEIETNLAAIIARSQALVVRDQNTFVDARTLQKDLDSYIKRVGFELDPGIAKAKDVLDHLKDQKERFVAPARAAKESIRQRADDWASEEKRKAATEQERINAAARAEAARIAAQERLAAEAQAEAERKEREKWAEIERKAAEKALEAQHKAGEISKREAEKQKKLAAEQAERERQAAAAAAQQQKELAAQQERETVSNVTEIRVAPSIPSVAGVKNQTYHFAAVENPALLIIAYQAAVLNNEGPRINFLERFITVDEQQVGQYAREQKNPAKVMADLPGVKAWSKG